MAHITGDTYLLGPEDVGLQVSVRVTLQGPSGREAKSDATSSMVRVQANPRPSPSPYPHPHPHPNPKPKPSPKPSPSPKQVTEISAAVRFAGGRSAAWRACAASGACTCALLGGWGLWLGVLGLLRTRRAISSAAKAKAVQGQLRAEWLPG